MSPAPPIPTDRRKHKILIVDDHPLVRQGLGDLILRQPDMEVCGEAASVAEAVEQCETTRPDAAVVDIILAGSNGIELVERLKTHHPEVRILVLSMHDESLYAERALRAGAMGYISKRESVREVIEAIRRVLRGEVYLSSQMVTQLLKPPAARAPLEQDPLQQLSPREMQVYELIGQGLTTQEIARELHLTSSTVETHRRNIRIKLSLDYSREPHSSA